MNTKLFLRLALCTFLTVMFLPARAKTWQEGSGNDLYYYYECDTVIDGIAYRMDEANLTASVTFFSRKYHVTTKYHPIYTNFICNFEHNYGDLQYRGDVIIPETVKFEGSTYTVTSVDTHAFDGCKEITDLQIPQSVYYDYAYWHGDAKEPDFIYGGMISWDSRYEYGKLCLSIDIGDGENGNYYKDPFPWLLEKPAGTVIYHGDEVALIVAQEWFESTNMYGFKMRDGRQTVNVDAVHIKEGTKTVMSYAAYRLSAANVTFPSSLEQVKSTAFLVSDIDNLVMDGVKTIGDSAFYLAQLGSVSMGNVERIGNCAFYQTQIGNSLMADNVKTIGDSAFYLAKLESVSVPKVERIGNSVFRESTLKHISLNPSLKAIGDYAFCDCKQLADVQLPDSLTTLGGGIFYECTGLTDVVLPNSLSAIGGAAFYGCSSLKNVVLPNSLTSIGGSAFYGCKGLEKIVIPYSVSTLGDNAFADCTSLTSITIPCTIKGIGRSIVDNYSCKKLTLTGNGGWTNLEPIVVASLYAKTLNIGNGITTLLEKLYSSAEVVNCYAKTPPECNSYTFRNYNGELHVPAGAMAAYFTAPIWENFTNLNADLTDKVTLEQTEAQMLKGDELQLSGATVPVGAGLVWGTTDPAVATVDASGKVMATGVGECDIYASLADNLAVYDACHIDVHSSAVVEVRFGQSKIITKPNKIVTVNLSYTPEDITYQHVFENSNPEVAIFKASRDNVQFLGITPGTTTLTATLAGVPEGVTVVPATCEITVVALEATDSVTLDKHDPAYFLSGTLPVLYVNTEGEKEIISRDEYLSGTYHLDAREIEGYENIGSAEAPLALQIKGHGNFTWGYDKKPYQLLLDMMATPLGMKSGKDFVLLANCEQGALSLYRDMIGLWLGKRLGLDWTPDIKPVELVINGDYRGLYNLTEQVCVAPERVDIEEQNNQETDPELITGGWLVKTDSYATPAYMNGDGTQVINQTNTGGGRNEGAWTADGTQLLIRSKIDGSIIRFTPKMPEALSDEQRAYLAELVATIDSLISIEDKDNREWENLIDIDALTRYYLVNEVMYDVEAFNNNCYFHKERGDNTKLVFGPVWNFGAAADEWTSEQESFLYNNESVAPFIANLWIGEIARFPRFQERLKAHWSYYVNNVHPELTSFLLQYYQAIATAATNGDYRRWPQYEGNGVLNACQTILRHLEQHYNWLITQWGHGYPGDVNGDDVVNGADITVLYNVLLGGATTEGSADVNGDGVISGADITKLYKLILNNETH